MGTPASSGICAAQMVGATTTGISASAATGKRRENHTCVRLEKLGRKARMRTVKGKNRMRDNYTKTVRGDTRRQRMRRP
eukprot:3633132-Amphidinium_carterae.1